VAKKQSDIKRFPTIYTFKRPKEATCGCGAEAEYEVYEHREPHCRRCMLEAVDCATFVVVRRIGGLDDAS